MKQISRATAQELFQSYYIHTADFHDDLIGPASLAIAHPFLAIPYCAKALGGFRHVGPDEYQKDYSEIIDARLLGQRMRIKLGTLRTYRHLILPHLPEAVHTEVSRRFDTDGGKAVLKDPFKQVRKNNPNNELIPPAMKPLLQFAAREIHKLNGRYITAEDVGMTSAHMDYMLQFTPFVTGHSPEPGTKGGDPSPFTARGVFATAVTIYEHYQGPVTKDTQVGIQGLGNVGSNLALFYLRETPTHIVGYDVNPEKVTTLKSSLTKEQQKRFHAVDSFEELLERSQIISPCALGGAITDDNVEHLQRDSIIVAGANNPLSNEELERTINQNGGLFLPDYLTNQGGVIGVVVEPPLVEHLKATMPLEVAVKQARHTIMTIMNSVTPHIAVDLVTQCNETRELPTTTLDNKVYDHMARECGLDIVN